jgi:hypothetical protein
MKDEQRRAIARIIRRQAKLFAELPALTSLLETYAKRNEAPHNWREMLEEIRKSDDYKAIVEEFEPIALRLENEVADDDLIEILLKMSEGKLPN